VNNDDNPDGEAEVRAINDIEGVFEYTPENLDYDASDPQITIRTRTKLWDPIAGDYVRGPWSIVEDSEATAIFTFDPAENNQATVDSLDLRNFYTPYGGYPTSSEPVFVGTVSNDGRRDGLVVQFDHSGDGTIDGSVVTDHDGHFLYRANGFTPSATSKTITARVVEFDYLGQQQ